MPAPKKARATAKLLLALSLENGQLSEARVGDVLAWFEQKPPAHAAAVLREYHRLATREYNRSRARIEFSGALASDAIPSILAGLTKLYHRPISATTTEDPSLIAGLRISIGDDVLEHSIAAQLETLSAATA